MVEKNKGFYKTEAVQMEKGDTALQILKRTSKILICYRN